MAGNTDLTAVTEGTFTEEPMPAAKRKTKTTAQIINRIEELKKQAKHGNTNALDDLISLLQQFTNPHKKAA